MPIPKKNTITNNETTKNKFTDYESDILDLDDLDLDNIDLDDDDDEMVNLPKSKVNEVEDDEEIETNEKRKSKVTPIKDTGPIAYSSRAHSDGYRFNSLSREEQVMTRYLYTSEDSLSSFYLATQRVHRMNDYPNERPYFNYGLGMPNDGYHLAHVYECTPSKTNPNAHVIKLLVSDSDMRCFTFTPGLLNPIAAAISRDLGIKNNIFKSAQSYEELRGCIVLFKVKNVDTQTGGKFCTIEEFHFLNEKEFSTIEKMTDIMFTQA